MKLALALHGLTPLVAHNTRLANPLDPYAVRLKEITRKAAKDRTDEDIIEAMRVESRGAIYETPEGLVGWPVENVWRCIQEASRAFKLGQHVKRGLLFDATVEPLEIGGEVHQVDAFLADPTNIDYRSMRVKASRVMRSRPIFRDWSLRVNFDALEDVLDLRVLSPVLERAGRLTGMGDSRPVGGGRFRVEVL